MSIEHKCHTFHLGEEDETYDTVEAASVEEALQMARESVDAASYGYNVDGESGQSTQFIRVAARCADEDCDEINSDEVTLEPEAPKCTEGAHEWDDPLEIVGGIKENPGVRGHGGGIISTLVCAHCGAYRVHDTWDQSCGPEPRETTTYRDAEERSL